MEKRDERTEVFSWGETDLEDIDEEIRQMNGGKYPIDDTRTEAKKIKKKRTGDTN